MLIPERTFPVNAYEEVLQAIHFERAQRTVTAFEGFDASWSQQGPTNVGGRVNAIALHPTDEDIIYVGFSGGGLFKTTDGGTNWNPIFDDQPFLAIGEITLDPSNPDVVYVGTGDPNITGYPFIGDGVYKSTDGGATWTHKGLTDQRIISRIIVNPFNTDIVYAAAMGLPMERNNDRGLYRSTNGGDTWEEILFVSNQAGIIDLVMNESDPDVLYAASWDRIRNATESFVNGPNAKIYKTIDGGDNWSVLTNGLPSATTMGRIGLDISRQNPNTPLCHVCQY